MREIKTQVCKECGFEGAVTLYFSCHKSGNVCKQCRKNKMTKDRRALRGIQNENFAKISFGKN